MFGLGMVVGVVRDVRKAILVVGAVVVPGVMVDHERGE